MLLYRRADQNSMITKSEITRNVLDELSIPHTIGFIQWLMPKHIRPSLIGEAGKFANPTAYYRPDDIKAQYEELDIEQLLKNYEEQKDTEQDEGYYAEVMYTEWVDNGRRKAPHTTRTDAFIKGHTAYLANGKQKRIDGKHFKIVFQHRERPEDFPENPQTEGNANEQ